MGSTATKKGFETLPEEFIGNLKSNFKSKLFFFYS